MEGGKHICSGKGTCVNSGKMASGLLAGVMTRVDHTGQRIILIMNLDLFKCIFKSNYFMKYYGAHLALASTGSV